MTSELKKQIAIAASTPAQYPTAQKLAEQLGLPIEGASLGSSDEID